MSGGAQPRRLRRLRLLRLGMRIRPQGGGAHRGHSGGGRGRGVMSRLPGRAHRARDGYAPGERPLSALHGGRAYTLAYAPAPWWWRAARSGRRRCVAQASCRTHRGSARHLHLLRRWWLPPSSPTRLRAGRAIRRRWSSTISSTWKRRGRWRVLLCAVHATRSPWRACCRDRGATSGR